MKKLGIILFVMALAAPAGAVNNTATSSGNWNTAGIWDKGHIPQAAEDVFVPAGITVVNNGVNNYPINTLSVTGTQQVTAADTFAWISNGVTISTGGVIMAFGITNAYKGSPVKLDGGTLRFDSSPLAANNTSYTTYAIGGNILVTADSIHNSYRSGSGRYMTRLEYGALDFAFVDPLVKPNGYLIDVTDTGCQSNFQPAKTITVYVGSTISNSGRIQVNRNCAESDTHKVELNNTAIRPGKTVAISQVGAGYSLLSGSLGVALLGGAEVLGSNSFTIVTFPSSGFTDSSIFDTTAGLWTNSNPTATSIAATLTNSVGSIGVGKSAFFAAEDAGYVSLTNLIAGTNYWLVLTIVDFAKLNTVEAQLSRNPAFSDIHKTGGKLALQFTAPSTNSYFAWDNFHSTSTNWCIGCDLSCVTLRNSPPGQPGTVVLIR